MTAQRLPRKKMGIKAIQGVARTMVFYPSALPPVRTRISMSEFLEAIRHQRICLTVRKRAVKAEVLRSLAFLRNARGRIPPDHLAMARRLVSKHRVHLMRRAITYLKGMK